MIEAEIRSFISKVKFDELFEFFKKEAILEKEDYQETYYFDCSEDLRIQRNSTGAKIWMKGGKMHDDAREETEIRFPREQFETAEKIFEAIGLNVSIKWFRERKQFNWNGIKVCLDNTKGYGYILELEKSVTENKASAIDELKHLFQKLNISITPKEEFENKFKYYKENWKSLV